MFIVLAVFQLFTPTKMILDQEAVLKKGIAYKFKTQPVDPSDPFRGKYITLSYDISSFKTNDSLWERNQPVYVYLTTDSLGFAKINSVSKTVLPTPAPPKRPALPPRSSGINTSIALIPVSKISDFVERRVSFGGARWTERH